MTTLNKPQGVVDHRHFWPGEDEMESDTNRIDVCELEDGTSVIWNVDSDEIVFRGSFAECLSKARSMVGAGGKESF